MKNQIVDSIVNAIIAEGNTVNLSGWHTDLWKMPQQ